MQVLQVISLLLDYPKADLLELVDELRAMVRNSELSADQQQALDAFIVRRTSGDLMDWQSEYDGMFERGRSLSLLLFEHVHGESRDRGQAMVDLMQQYQQAGLDIGVKELPDYIPLYLEFLATQGTDNAREGLAEVAHILAVLTARLEARESDYAVLFESLLELSSVQVDLADVRSQVENEKRDDTPKELDKVWEEEMVTFTGNDATSTCSTAQSRPAESQRRDQYIPLNLDQLSNVKNAADV
ncbi:Nitrate reductase molybdenum cofactor assembly chaperone NarJ [Pseudidiomarina piscicola]|uniref:Nitrate reductase molybdenum cofactor assembly chaperone NarJ n=1 Tax=Pseudidiomarina piscicola TaxID=2614830 RepID=A0A6S6WL48_9GAMM|nr:nitrate reductase molybdenum cofactor assembly chaperone [Pseudidiomarina piscicola]CAB0151488.1 Nitrate reductase molybdenum cofactor assembly chaperone NarJ [Pseudidiomarina piscicola]VZT40967.1 Nitrate reductase molybdenum cofactor assembly chaperone NarJ [Pseudomonas aeruginosa]